MTCDPDYSIVIPAYNEAALLPDTLASVKRAMQAVGDELLLEGEVIVADNNSTDATAQIANDAGAHLVFEPVNQISKARNAGANAASGRYLIFLDADTLLNPELLKVALKALETGDVCGGGAQVEFSDTERYKMAQFFSRFLNWMMRKTRLAAGCFVFCRADGFEAVGGFSEKVYASEEIWFSRQLKTWGKRAGPSRFHIVLSPRVQTSSRKLESSPSVIGFTLLSFVFPFFIYFRSLCGFWYKQRTN